jgi:molybdenum cofactor guanylyltransferase
MKSTISFSGAVLAGGASSRFGENKALYVYKQKPLIGWVLESLSQASEQFVIANQPFTIKTIPDIIPGGNALSGLHAALSYANFEWVAVAACDLPFLTSGYWRLLLEHTRESQMVIAKNPKGDLEPLAALYHRSVLATVEQQLTSGDLMIKRMTEKVRCVKVPWSKLETHFENNLFLNANYKTDLP